MRFSTCSSQKILFSPGLTSDGYLCADGQSTGAKDYEEHQYVNTQNLENLASLGAEGPRGGRAPDSPKRDIFDMSESARSLLVDKQQQEPFYFTH